MYEGYQWREKREIQHFAQLASWVTAPHLKKPIDPKKLLAEDKPKVKTTKEKSLKVISDLEKLVGVS